MQLTVSVVDANSAKEAMEPVPLVHSGSDRLFKQRNPLDMVLVAVPFAKGMSHGSGTPHEDRFHGSLILSHFHTA